jgi:rubrerythrin
MPMTELLNLYRDAIANEVKSRAFYALASEVTTDDAARMVFIELSEAETHHAEHLVEKAAASPLGTTWDAAAYLEELESTTTPTLAPAHQAIIRDGDMRAVLELAKEMEVRARNTYRGLLDGATDDDSRTFFGNMLAEEEQHLAEVERLLLSLDTPDDMRPAL